MAIITRVGFCPLCERSRNPKGGQKFLAFGSTSNAYHVYEADHNGRIGFTPHIYKLEKVLGENVVILKACAMAGCGVDIDKSKQGDFYYVKTWEREIWTLEKWNALVLYKHDSDYEV